jgi:DNA-binding NtrC family response regulator
MEPVKSSILVVEDEEDVRSGIAELIDKEKFFVFEAATGAEAIEKAAGIYSWFEFGIVLLDIKLPDMSGIEVLKKIKAENFNLCVIMVTAMKDIPLAVEAMKEGATDYVTKPFSGAELAEKIEKLDRAMEMERNFFFMNDRLDKWRADFDKRVIEARQKDDEKFKSTGRRLTLQEYIETVHPPLEGRLEFKEYEALEKDIRARLTKDVSVPDKKARVLVVEDEEDVRSGIVSVLSGDHEVTEAGSVGQATAVFKKGLFDVALLDIRLPDGSGIDLLKKLKSIDPDTVYIMATAFKDLDMTIESMKSGADNYITKPFTANEIKTAVRRPLEVRRHKLALDIMIKELQNQAR